MAEVKFHAELQTWHKFLIALVLVVLIVIAAMVAFSTTLGLHVLGVFIQMTGVLLLSLGLVHTNDDLLFIAEHHKTKDVQAMVTHLASQRFQLMLAIFLLVLGMLLEILAFIFA